MVAPVPPADRAPPAEGVNLRYAVHPVLPASRSAGSMVKLGDSTTFPILFAENVVEGPESQLVLTVTELLESMLAASNLMPVRVTDITVF